MIHSHNTHIAPFLASKYIYKCLRLCEKCLWKKLSQEGYLETGFPNLTASHVPKDSLSRRIFSLGKKNKESKTIYTSYEKHKGINAYWYNITQNIYVLMFEVSWTSEGKSLWRTTTERNGEACMKYLFLFTITMHDRTITVVPYNDTQIE